MTILALSQALVHMELTKWRRSDDSGMPVICGKGLTSATLWCDEYPFFSTKEGDAGASLRIVPMPEQVVQRNTLDRFYNWQCHLIPDDPDHGAFVVLPDQITPVTLSFCKGRAYTTRGNLTEKHAPIVQQLQPGLAPARVHMLTASRRDGPDFAPARAFSHQRRGAVRIDL
jgi:hypothetical protein